MSKGKKLWWWVICDSRKRKWRDMKVEMRRLKLDDDCCCGIAIASWHSGVNDDRSTSLDSKIYFGARTTAPSCAVPFVIATTKELVIFHFNFSYEIQCRKPAHRSTNAPLSREIVSDISPLRSCHPSLDTRSEWVRLWTRTLHMALARKGSPVIQASSECSCQLRTTVQATLHSCSCDDLFNQPRVKSRLFWFMHSVSRSNIKPTP